MKNLPVTIIMLTLNEEYNLPGALENIKEWANEIFIVDSLSSDRTVEIALKHNAKVIQHPFTNFGDQWNFALTRLPIKNPWTIKLDPDERFSEELIIEIAKTINRSKADDGYKFQRRLWFMGKPLHIKQRVLRLWKTGKCKFSDVLVNEHPLIEGKIGFIKGYLEHFDSPSLFHWYDKQNHYSTMEAIMQARGDKLAAQPRLFGNALERRMYIKHLYFKIPLRHFLLRNYYYWFNGAWLDGEAGRIWTKLRSDVMRMKEYKYKEMKWSGQIFDLPRRIPGNYDQRIINTDLQKETVR